MKAAVLYWWYAVAFPPFFKNLVYNFVWYSRLQRWFLLSRSGEHPPKGLSSPWIITCGSLTGGNVVRALFPSIYARQVEVRDLSKYGCVAAVKGRGVRLEDTTSPVDPGDKGKVAEAVDVCFPEEVLIAPLFCLVGGFPLGSRCCPLALENATYSLFLAPCF